MQQQRRRSRTGASKGDHLKKDISLTCLLANESTGKVRRLLEDMGVKDIKNHAELEYHLAKVYQKAENKANLEKKLAEAHPHKELILKYLGQPTENPTADDVLKELKKEIEDVKVPSYPSEQFHNCAGNSVCAACSQKMSNACGCGSSNFGGNINPTPAQVKQAESNLVTIGIISIVALFGMAVYAKTVK